MTKSRYDKPFMELARIIPYDHFRTIESFETGRCPTEVKATLELKQPFMQTLSFALPWDGLVYAYVRFSDGYRELCKSSGLVPEQTSVYINDWDDRFQLQIEGKDPKDTVSIFLRTDDMRELLERCCRIPAHNKPRLPDDLH